MMEFVFPWRQLPWWVGAALLALVAIGVTLRWLEKRRQARLGLFAEAELAPRLLVGYDPKARRPLGWLTMLGFAFLALALMQPHWGETWQKVRRQSHDVAVCLDTSESMRAEDPLPNRLVRAKQKLESVLDKTPGDRYALVAFSGAAQLQSPLTTDHGYFRAVLGAVDTDIISLEGTNIADALDEAVKALKGEGGEASQALKDLRAILLISDGESVSGDAIEAAEDAAKYAHVYVMGVGDPQGAEVTLSDFTGRKRTHTSKLDEEMLARVAQAGDGVYVRSTADNWDIDQLHELIQKMAARNVASDVRFRLVNRYQWPLAAAILCFAAEGVWLVLLPLFRGRRMRKSEQSEAEDYA